MSTLAVDRMSGIPTRPHCAGPGRAALLATAMAWVLASSGCGLSLPGLHGHTAKPATAPRAASNTQSPRSKHAKSSSEQHAKNQRDQRDMSPREQLVDARTRAASTPNDPYWPYRLGELYAAADSAAPAETALRQALARDRGYAPALALLSRLYYQAGRHDEAIRMLEASRVEARRTSGDLAPELLAGLALHYDALGQRGPARDALAAVPRAAHRATAAAAAAVALHDAAPDSAADLAQAAVREYPNSAACQNNYGIARLRAGDPAAARRAFLKAIELDPHRAGPFYNLAILEKYYGFDDAAAVRWFARYRALSDDDPDGLAGVLGNTQTKELAGERQP